MVAVNSLLHELSVLRRQVKRACEDTRSNPVGSDALAQLEALTLHVNDLTLPRPTEEPG